MHLITILICTTRAFPALGEAAPAPLSPQASVEGLSGVGYLLIFHPPPLISQDIEAMKPSHGKTTKNPWILPQQPCEVCMEIRFFSFPKSEKQGWKWEVSKGLPAHLSPKKASLNSPINDNFVAAAGRGEKDPFLHKFFFWSLLFLGEN